MTALLIRGIPVSFPFTPYPAQVEYMETVMDALSSSSRALLESPTGTGKTLCMLCACIAWVQHHRRLDCGLDLALTSRSGAQSSRRGRSKKDGAAGVMEGPTRRPLRILYTSRTHAQLAQVVRELRKTEYREIKMAVLGSREHLCIHPNVSRTAGGSQAMTSACNHLREEQNCRFFKRIQHNLSNTRFLEALSGAGSGSAVPNGGSAFLDTSEYLGSSSGAVNDESESAALRDRVLLPAAHDIEDLCKSGRSVGFCPYFYERAMAREADVVFLPYTYLFDPQVRRQLPVSLEDAIVIIDEAHNLPSVLSASSNVTLEPVDVSNAIREVAVAMNFLQSDAQSNRDNMSAADAEHLELTVERLSALRLALQGLEEAIHLAGHSSGSTLPPGSAILDFSRNPTVSTDPVAAANAQLERVYKGSAVFELLRSCGWTRTMWLGDGPLEDYWDAGGGSHSASRAASDSFSGAVSEAVAALANSENGSPGLSAVQQLLDHVYLSDASATEMDEYCRLVLLGSVKGGSSAAGRGPWQGGGRGATASCPVPPNQRAWSVGFWTLEASVAMHRAVEGVRGLLLTSGTLSPLEHFAAEIGLTFPFALAGKHVIESSQVLCCVMSRGPDGRALNGSHAFRGNDGYKMSLGFALLNVARSVPNGMLVFFPSYSAMHGAVDLWKMGSSGGDETTTLWGQLSVLKTLFVEPVDSGELKAVIAAFQRQAERDDHGAILFAVCRGKVSEGIDFADRHGRCVLVAGIPYANQTDLFVRLKRQYLTQVAPSRPKVQGRPFTGDDWYRQEAMRTVNQAIGRVIRHKDDFGAVVLADERFAQQREWLPQWLRPSYLSHPSFRECYAALGAFFEARRPSRRQRTRGAAHAVNPDDPVDDVGDKGEMAVGSLSTRHSAPSMAAATPLVRKTAPLCADLAASHLEQTLDDQKRRAEEEKRKKLVAKQAGASDTSDAVGVGSVEEEPPRRRARLFAKQQVVVVVAPPTQQGEQLSPTTKHPTPPALEAIVAIGGGAPALPQQGKQDAKLRLVQLLRSKLVPSAYDSFREQLVRLVTLTKQLRVAPALNGEVGKEASVPDAGAVSAAHDSAKQDLRHEFRRLVSDVEALFRAHISVESDIKDAVEAFHACLPQQFRPVTASSKRSRSPLQS